MNKDIWVYIEQNHGSIAPVSLELLNEAQRLKEKMKNPGTVTAIVMGDHIGSLTEVCMEYGAEKVYAADDPRLKLYHPEYYAAILVNLITSHDPHIILFGATYSGSQLAPMTAARVKTGVAAHSIELKVDEGDNLVAVVPAFGGKVLGDILIPNHRPQMASVKAGILDKPVKRNTNGEVQYVPLDFLDSVKVRLQPLSQCREDAKGVSLEEADVVVCGGFGVGDKERWGQLQALAEALGGALGCTRPALDEGWAEGEHQMIGTSGKSIRPKVYIGFGISGATHHVCGMKDAGFVVSVNQDEGAEIFKVSDLGLVGDVNQMLPQLLEVLGQKN